MMKTHVDKMDTNNIRGESSGTETKQVLTWPRVIRECFLEEVITRAALKGAIRD